MVQERKGKILQKKPNKRTLCVQEPKTEVCLLRAAEQY